MTDSAAPLRCELAHPGFRALGEPVFRCAEGSTTPAMVVHIGDRHAALPLEALRAEFGIDPDSPDGRMLALIAAALDFVTALRPGDPLPAEVLTGGASWAPSPEHVAVASARLQWLLLRWLSGGTDGGDAEALTPQVLLASVEDPAVRPRVQEAMRRAADAIGVPAASDVSDLIDTLAEELAYIEALRERLLLPVAALKDRLHTAVRAPRDRRRQDMLLQVQRLIARAAAQIGTCFDELEAQTGEIIPVLRNAANQRSFISTRRNWLYRSQRAWEEVLDAWVGVDASSTEALWHLIARTYRFLAPRYLSVKEWQSALPGRKAEPKWDTAMVW